MKKIILLSILLFVGCAHQYPQAEFYIGMSEKEFLMKNNLNLSSEVYYNHIRKRNFIYQRGDGKRLGSIPLKVLSDNEVMYTEYSNLSRFSPYYYVFINDSLVLVSKGLFNLSSRKPIDYDKYATSPELKEPKEPQEPKEGVMPTVPDVKIPVQPTPPETEEEK